VLTVQSHRLEWSTRPGIWGSHSLSPTRVSGFGDFYLVSSVVASQQLAALSLPFDDYSIFLTSDGEIPVDSGCWAHGILKPLTSSGWTIVNRPDAKLLPNPTVQTRLLGKSQLVLPVVDPEPMRTAPWREFEAKLGGTRLNEINQHCQLRAQGFAAS
jgi:hypothetical protein